MEKDKQGIKDRFQFPDSMKIRILSDEERACHSYADEVAPTFFNPKGITL